MQTIRSTDDDASALTLGKLVAAVLDVTDDERLVAPVVLSMLRRGSVRLGRHSAPWASQLL